MAAVTKFLVLVYQILPYSSSMARRKEHLRLFVEEMAEYPRKNRQIAETKEIHNDRSLEVAFI